MRFDGLWRRGAGTADDPDNGRMIFRLIGFHPSSWRRNLMYADDLQPVRFMYVRLFFNEFLRRYRYEVCMRCGRTVGDAVGTWWSAPDELWQEVVGDEGGVLCARCFAGACGRRGKLVYFVATVSA